MSRAKKASKRKSRACAVPLLGAARLSLSMVSGAPAATVGPTAHEITLGEEEISDVSLATFYVFDKENPGGRARRTTCWPRRRRLSPRRRRRLSPAAAEAVATAARRLSPPRLRRLSPRRLRRLRRLRRHWWRLRWLWRLWRLFGRLLVLAERCSDLVLLLITGSPSEPLCPKWPSSTGTSPPSDMYARG